MPSPVLVQRVHAKPGCVSNFVVDDGEEYFFPVGESGYNECLVKQKHLAWFKHKDRAGLFVFGKEAEARFNGVLFQGRAKSIRRALGAMIDAGNAAVAAAMIDRALRAGAVPSVNRGVIDEMRDRATAAMNTARVIADASPDIVKGGGGKDKTQAGGGKDKTQAGGGKDKTQTGAGGDDESVYAMLDAENGVMAKYTDNVRFMAQSGGDNSGAIEVLDVDGSWKRAGEWRFDGGTGVLETPLDEGADLPPELQAQKDESAEKFALYLVAREAAPVPTPENKDNKGKGKDENDS